MNRERTGVTRRRRIGILSISGSAMPIDTWRKTDLPDYIPGGKCRPFFDDHDELYWNVTGDGWKAPILSVSARVSLVSLRESRSLPSGCYTGVAGSTESECVSETMNNSGIFTSRRILQPGEGFTIALGWDKGIVAAPSSWKRFLWEVDLKENWVFLLPCGIFLHVRSLVPDG